MGRLLSLALVLAVSAGAPMQADAASADVAWWLQPIDPSRPHDVGLLVSWHGRLMTVAWVFLLPLGIFAARFFKITPRQKWPEMLDNTAWWNAHRALQYSGGVAVLLAMGLILSRPNLGGLGWHGMFGWLTIGLLAVQFVSAWLRGSKGGPTDKSLAGDHFDMTLRRRVFEYVHKFAGYLALALAAAAVLLGLSFVNAPIWMWLAIVLWWAVLGGVFGVLQRAGRATDTYQAIWGPDPGLPGNQVRPIGWGIKRLPADASD